MIPAFLKKKEIIFPVYFKNLLHFAKFRILSLSLNAFFIH